MKKFFYSPEHLLQLHHDHHKQRLYAVSGILTDVWPISQKYVCGRTPPVVERLAIASQSPKHDTFSIIVKLSKISSCKFIISKLSLSTHPLASEIVTRLPTCPKSSCYIRSISSIPYVSVRKLTSNSSCYSLSCRITITLNIR